MRSPFTKPRLGELIDPTHPLNRRLVGAWILNEGMGSHVGDSTWQRNAGSAIATPTWTGAIDEAFHSPGPCLVFDGATQYVQIPHLSRYDDITAFSVELVYAPTVNTTKLVFGRGGFGTVTDWGIGQAGLHTAFQVAGTLCSSSFFIGLGFNTFEHAVGTYDGNNLRIYTGGKLGNTVAASGFSYSGAADFFLGKNPNAGTFFAGKVAMVRFWAGRALNLADVEQLYAEPFVGWMPSSESRRWYSFSRNAQTVQARARIRVTSSHSVQARANIHGRTTQTVQVKANITPRQQRATTPKANIRAPLPATDPSGVYTVESWEISDELTSVSPTFSVRFKGSPSISVGGNVSIAGGYDNNNVQLIRGVVDDVTTATTPDSIEVTVTGRSSGARELQGTVVTFTVPASPPAYVVNTAHDVVKVAGGGAQLPIGQIDFPDYFIFAPFAAIGKTVLEVAAELAQPFNQFASRQFHTRIGRDGLAVYGVDYTAPSAGITIPRSLIYRMQRRQRAYLEPPILKNVEALIVRGASWTVPKTNLGTVTKNEYFRTVSMAEVGGGLGGQVPAPGDNVQPSANSGALQQIVTEISSSQTLYGDKLLDSDEQVVVNGTLTAETLERYWYIEPGTILTGGGPAQLDAPTLISQSANPSADSLLFMTSILRFGLVDTGNGIVFQEIEQSVRQCFYDSRGNLACEATTTAEYDTTALEWKITEMNVRTHAETTSGATRTQFLNLQYTGSLFEFNTADTQVVAGGRPNTTQRNSRRAVTTVQAQSPFADLDAQGHPIDVGAGLVTWTYESPYLDQHTCDFVVSYAEAELPRQLLNWDEIEIECPLLPNAFAGIGLSVETSTGVFTPYVAEEVIHNFEANRATSRVVGKRLG